VSTFPPSPISFQLRFLDWFQQYCPWVLQGLAVLYGMIVRIRRIAYQRGWLRQQHLPKPVVSVGNITVGGTGKTPFVIWLAQQLHAKGKRVAILSRGYGRQDPSKNLMVSDGQGHVKEWRVSGDEPTMIAYHCPWAIVAVGPNRFRLGQWVMKQTTCDCFILDDGYQHLSLYRDLDLLLFDATDIKGLAGVLPAGRLREPLEAAKGAGAIVLTRADSLSSIQPVQMCIEKVIGQLISPIILKTVPKQIQHLVTGEVRPLTFLLKSSLLAVSGIGNPGSFREMLTGCGVQVCEEILFPDHCAYGQAEVSLLRKKIDQSDHKIVITTEKDAVKLRDWFTKDDSVWSIITDLEFISGERHVLELLDCTGIV
jgi:tetraacyldisaccharide 4'-kinase